MGPSPCQSDNTDQDLAKRMEQIELRLEAVERRLGIETGSAAPALLAASLPAQESSLSDTGALAALAGKSLLGLAAAYLLRALTESGTLPPAAGVGLGLLYALAWLVWAARSPASEELAVSLRALSSALILGPLLWEAHLRFQATTSWQTAGILTLFSVTALAISWRKNQTAVALIGSLAGLGMSAAFLLRTHDVVPYGAALLGLALAVEASACLDHYLGERWVVAFFANLAVLLATYVATRPPGALEGYPAISRGTALALQVSLLLVYLASTIVRTLLRHCRISVFELAQASLAAVIALWGALVLAEGHPRAVLAAGVFCLALGAVCYLISIRFLAQHAGSERNFWSYATFGLAFVLAGCWLLAPASWRAALWVAVALVCSAAGRTAGRALLRLHAGVYAVLALAASGLAARANAGFLGTAPHPGAPLPPSWWFVAAGAVAAYAIPLLHKTPQGENGIRRAADFLLAASGFWALAAAGALAAAPLCRNAADANPARDFCPTALTFILSALAAAGAAGFGRWQRPELKWLAWLLALIATYKLLVQDLQHALAFGMVLSLLVYGAVLIWLPRLMRTPARHESR